VAAGAGWSRGRSAEASDRFLADYRRTIADLLTEHHFAEITKILHAEGLRYDAEAPGVDLPTIADGLQAKGQVDIPMGEFWVYPEGKPPPPAHLADVREAASAAHVYGKPLVGAEALTTMGEDPWRTGPWQHKRIVDRYMAEGVNHFVLHTSAHQPFTDRKPGMTLRQYGQHLSRNETWAEGRDAGLDRLSGPQRLDAASGQAGAPTSPTSRARARRQACPISRAASRTCRRAGTSITWTPRA
jgi:hypothetical protein